eukprot:jgi/Mesen1/3593/ME000020S03121
MGWTRGSVQYFRVQVGVQSPGGVSASRGLLRRFSDFLKLHAALRRAFPHKRLPAPPPKNALQRMSQPLLEQRRAALEDWLARLLEDLQVARSAAIAAFLELEAAARAGVTACEEVQAAGSSGPAEIPAAAAHPDRTPPGSLPGAFSPLGSSPGRGPAGGAAFSPMMAGEFSSYAASSDGYASDASNYLGGSGTFSLPSEGEEAAGAGSPEEEEEGRDGLRGSEGGVLLEGRGPAAAAAWGPSGGEGAASSSDQSGSGAARAKEEEGEDASEAGHLQLALLRSPDAHTRTGPHRQEWHSGGGPSGALSDGGGGLAEEGGALLLRGEGEGGLRGRSLGGGAADGEAGEGEPSVLLPPGAGVILPASQRGAMARLVAGLRGRLRTASADVGDLLSRLKQEMAVKDFLASKEAAASATQRAELAEGRAEELELAAAGAREEARECRAAREGTEAQARGEAKVLAKEVRGLRKALVELQERADASALARTELEATLKEEQHRAARGRAARSALLHEVAMLSQRLRDCSIDHLAQEDEASVRQHAAGGGSLSPLPGGRSDVLDLLVTSDNRIGLLLAEAQLIAQGGDDYHLSEPSKASIANGGVRLSHSAASSTSGPPDSHQGRHHLDGSDASLRKAMADMLLSNAQLRRGMNQLTRHALTVADSAHPPAGAGATGERVQQGSLGHHL